MKEMNKKYAVRGIASVMLMLTLFLLLPFMADSVCVASAKETAQTQDADGDQMRSLYDTYYL